MTIKKNQSDWMTFDHKPKIVTKLNEIKKKIPSQQKKDDKSQTQKNNKTS